MKNSLICLLIFVAYFIAKTTNAQNKPLYLNSTFSSNFQWQLENNNDFNPTTRRNSAEVMLGMKFQNNLILKDHFRIEFGLGISNFTGKYYSDLHESYVDWKPTIKLGYSIPTSHKINYYFLGRYSYLVGNGNQNINGIKANTHSTGQVIGINTGFNINVINNLGFNIELNSAYEMYSKYRISTPSSSETRNFIKIQPSAGLSLNF